MGFSPTGLCAITWNANGLLGKVDDLREFIGRVKPDIILLQEIRLSGADSIAIPNYTFYSTPTRTGYRRRCRGTAILIKSTINHQYIPNPILHHIEATMVNLPNIPPINFVSAYRPPYDALFTLDFELLYACNSAIFIAGDLNARHRSWNSTKNCRYGKQLKNFAAGPYRGDRAPLAENYCFVQLRVLLLLMFF
ncbi:hypothetical protein AVEN_271384-1 [Araneus ventricosus]|uniref:Endonuclease/exonuclease/phosphatase domain-containing protein n=1 Tax=Araneus ventricosus TaxID=182803 RepID=A0A4Y2K1F5_ARAVE|nr:hypothetical protein AVEN_271384-1 [Araneus ventricosus]